ncbi:MAG: hypothetical protein HYV02_01950 [Deltaproteobacteria bacterium]|nr:hypothetical protein [Deltaproteobacteria bacterium]
MPAPHEPLQRLIDYSPLLGSRLQVHPEWMQTLENDPYTTSAKPREQLERECAGWCHHAQDLAQGLRWFKYYELIRIAWRDLNAETAVEPLLADWTLVAEVAIAHAFHQVCHTLTHTLHFGEPLHQHVVLLALGKLGATELNISSDIDLMLCFDESVTERLASHMPPLVRDFTRLLQQQTADGFVFRVDWDLRPEGAGGPPGISTAAAMQYYEARGSDWERVMLIRARPIAGNLAIGHALLKTLHAFIYPRYTSSSIVDALHSMKQEISAAYQPTALHLKFGQGGIREVEFITHALLVLHGGKHPAVQTHSTFDALRHLVAARLLPRTHGTGLLEGYAYLRHLENRLQLIREQQTHTLPADRPTMEHLATAMAPGTDDPVGEVTDLLTRHMAHIHGVFRMMFALPYEKIAVTEILDTNLHTCNTLEEKIDGLTWSKRSVVTQILTADLEETLPFPEVTQRLTLLAEACVEAVLQMTTIMCQARYGVPRTPRGEEIPFAIIALGSCGAFEMDYGSDLDLLFLYRDAGETDGAHVVPAAEFFSRLAQKILSLLTIRHRYGRLYAVDTTLRPSGECGVLVTPYEAFCRYHRDDAALWERQAFLRARPIAGESAFLTSLATVLPELPFAVPFPTEGTAEIRRLRERMAQERGEESPESVDVKFGPGGYADIECLVQMLQLRHGETHRPLRVGNTWSALQHLGALRILPHETAQQLSDAYAWLKRLLAHYRVASNATTTRIDVTGETFAQVVRALSLGSTAEAIARIHAVRRQIRTVYGTYVA